MSKENERVLFQSRAEKIELQSRLNEFKAKVQELLEDKHAWVSEKEIFGSDVPDLQTKIHLFASERGLLIQKNREVSTEVDSLVSKLNENNANLAHLEDEMEQIERVPHNRREEKIDLQSKLNESKERIQNMLGQIEQHRYLWDEESRNLETTHAELEIRLELMAGETGLMGKRITELVIETEFLKAQENEYNATLVSMEEERQVLKAESSRNEERLQSLVATIATMENKTNSLQQQVNEGVEQRIDLIEQYRVTEHCLQQRNEILQEEVDRSRALLETKNQRIEELETALHSLRKDLEAKERRTLQLRSPVLEYGRSTTGTSLETRTPKPNHAHDSRNRKPNGVIEQRITQGLLAKATPTKAVHEKRTSAKPVSENRRASKTTPQKQTPSKVPAKRTASKITPKNQTPSKLPAKRAPRHVSVKQSPNIGPEKPWR